MQSEPNYLTLSKEALLQEKARVSAEYEAYCAQGLRLNLSRGVPSEEQLALSMDLLDILDRTHTFRDANGADCRNYGVLDGIPEAKALLAPMMDVPASQVIVGGNSSLNMMYDALSRAMLFGVYGGEKPWCRCETVKFLCPVPGYDRHFAITEQLGIEMINVPMLETGPDMDLVEELVSGDESIKGIWCTPKYSNPQGVCYSDETVRRLAALRPAAKDFRIFWDNAYSVHHLDPEHPVELLSIYDECLKRGSEDMVYLFCSTSKISFSGAGVAAMAASDHNLALLRRQMGVQTIGYDKLNQLRHVLYFKDINGIHEHMKKHAAIIAPKFEAVLRELQQNFEKNPIARWTEPKGGYFISVDVLPGTAKRVVELCSRAGVQLTAAGSTYPYHRDPKDENIRVAPTCPPLEDVQTVSRLFCLCVRLAALEQLV